MSELNKWHKIDNSLEEKVKKVTGHTLRFIRPIDSKTYSLSCPVCNNIVSTTEDMESIKANDACEECYLIYYYKNKEEWEKGWRPEINNKE